MCVCVFSSHDRYHIDTFTDEPTGPREIKPFAHITQLVAGKVRV